MVKRRQADTRKSCTRVFGFTYVALLIAVAIVSAGLAVVGQVASKAAEHERMTELIWRAEAIRRAIGRYYESSPGVPRYPPALAELAKDSRFVVVRRHLRRVYRDPLTGAADWLLVPGAGGGVAGVASKVRPERVFEYRPQLAPPRAGR